jgi:DNA-directed RNA polymerase specialized sigma24 family protein
MDKGGEEMPDFEEVYRLYFADVYKYILALSRDGAVAEEITQETFFRALATIGTFRGDCRLRVWLCQIARNLYTDLCRERRRFRDSLLETGDGGIEERLCDRDAGGSTSCSTPCRSPTRRCSPCGLSGSCPLRTSGSCSKRARAGPG